MGAEEARGRERRRSARLENHGQLAVHLVSDAMPVSLLDLSPGGFAMLSPKPFEPGSIHRFLIAAGQGPGARLTARAVHSRPTARPAPGERFLTGFALVDMDDQRRRAVDALLDALISQISFE